MTRGYTWLAAAFGFGISCFAQESQIGVTMPVTLSAGFFRSERLRTVDSGASSVNGGFRAMLYPTLKLGEHWFVYGAIQARTLPYFYYDAYHHPDRARADLIQGFAGYTRRTGGYTWLVKAGQLTSAFGAFPPRYDDAENPLLDQPLNYLSYLRLRPDQVVCGVSDIQRQTDYAFGVHHYCGGATDEHTGMQPATLYGIPGIEADIAGRWFDARVQLTNSSPSNPQGLRSRSQHPQWTAGGGVTPIPRLRIGGSHFRGPYLERDIQSQLDAGVRYDQFNATATGIDAQWKSGRWSVQAEWQRFEWRSLRLVRPPTMRAGYVELKAVITPRLYLAGRGGMLRFGGIEDRRGATMAAFMPRRTFVEFAAGYRFSRSLLLKTGYEYLSIAGVSGRKGDVLGVQFVWTVHSLSHAFR